MSNTQRRFCKKHYFQNYMYPERSVEEPFEIKAIYSVGPNKYLVNNKHYIDLEQGRLLLSSEAAKLFIPMSPLVSSQVQKLCEWSQPFKIEGSLNKGRQFFRQAVKQRVDLLKLPIYNVPFNANDNTSFRFTSPYLFITSEHFRKKIYDKVGQQFSSVVDAYLGIFAQRYFYAMGSSNKVVYVVPVEILEEISEEICLYLCKSVY